MVHLKKMTDLKPGRELDAWIAEHVMGWKLRTPYPDRWLNSEGMTQSLPHYSTDIYTAWDLLDKLSESNFLIETRTYMKQPWQSQVLILKSPESEWIVAVGETMPHAICLAAMKAIENS